MWEIAPLVFQALKCWRTRKLAFLLAQLKVILTLEQLVENVMFCADLALGPHWPFVQVA